MKKILKRVMIIICLFVVLFNSQGQTIFKAVLNGTYNSHENNNYTTFHGGAPTDWANFVAGQSGYGTFEYEYGMNWNPNAATHTALDNADDVKSFLRNAVNNGFDLVYMYASGENDPDYVDYAAHHGCAVITKYGNANANARLDYKTRTDLPIRGMGPTPAMTVSCGSQSSTTHINQYGPQLEFIDNYDQQSYVFSYTAAKYAVIKSAHPTWNVFDVRQALRQTCTHYAAGWCEEIGYGFPQVIARNNYGGSSTQPTLPTDANNLDAGPPIQPYAQPTSGGTQVIFTWYNFHQTAFASTIIMANGTTIYDGDGTSFLWTPNISGNIDIEFYTKLTDGRMSRQETYTKVPIITTAYPDSYSTHRDVPIDMNVLANDASGNIGAALSLVSVSALSDSRAGTIAINSGSQTIHFTPARTFLGTITFTYTMSDGANQANGTVSVTVSPKSGNTAPVILHDGSQQFPDQQVYEGETREIPFTVTDDFTQPQNLIESLTSSDAGFICYVTGTGESRMLHIDGASAVNNATATLGYKDEDTASSSVSFHVTVLSNPNRPAFTQQQITSGSFTFTASGAANSTWTVYSSTDLKSWTPVGSVGLNASGAGSFTDNGINGQMYKFYKLNDGTYTSRAIGFERKLANPGYATIANQLDASQNTLDGLFNLGANHTMPDGTTLPSGTQIIKGSSTYTWNGTSWLNASGQSAGSTTLASGEEARIYNPGSGSLLVTFVGRVPEGQLAIAIPVQPGMNLVSAMIPQGGTFSQLFSYNPTDGDTIDQLIGGIWHTTFRYYDASPVGASPSYPAGWYDDNSSSNDPIDPVIQVGESFIIRSAATSTKYLFENYSASGGNVPALTQQQITSGSFTFNASGAANSSWSVYSSVDLKSWTAVGNVALDGSGAGSFTDSGINGQMYKFYKLSNGTYTSRAIGFERKLVPPGNSQTANLAGYAAIANQLDASQNTLDGLFNIGSNHTMPDGTSLPTGTKIFKSSSTYTWNGTSWLNASGQSAGSVSLSPGEWASIYNPGSGSLMVTFVGLVREGQLAVPVQPGINFVSAMIPQAGTFSQLFSYNPRELDTISQWTGAGWVATAQYYDASPGYPAGWYSEASGLNDLIDPAIQVGESFIIESVATGTKYLVRNYSVSGGNVPALTQQQITSGSFTFTASGVANSAWTVYSSTDLKSWTAVGSVTLASGAASYTDNNVANVSSRFYKLSDGNARSRVVGFYRMTAGSGYTPVANQLDVSPDDDATKNTLTAVFSQTTKPSSGMVFIKGSDNSHPYIWNGNVWSGSTTLSPGEGNFIQNNSGASITLTFVGYVREGGLIMPLPYGTVGFVSSMIPLAGGIQSVLGYQPTSGANGGDRVMVWGSSSWGSSLFYFNAADATAWEDDGNSYSAGWYDMGGTQYSEPTVKMGEPFAIAPVGSGETWMQSFDAGQ